MGAAISAILITRSHAHVLPRVLDGLAKQTLPESEFEIVVVDDGSKDDTQAVLGVYADKQPMRIFRQNPSGVAAAKNLGVFTARAPIVVFLYDDEVLDPGALEAHINAHKANPDLSDVVLGATRLAPEIASSPLMRYVTGAGGQLFSYKQIRTGHNYGWREFWGGRSSCKREFLLTHAMFDPTFRFGYEDVEYAWRLRYHKLRVIYEPAASTTLIRAIDFDAFCDCSYSEGRSAFRLSQTHPEDEIRAYCEIDRAFAIWKDCRRDYAAILRRARKLDTVAAEKIGSGKSLTKAEQTELEMSYSEAFTMSRAKGVVDANWITEKTAMPRPTTYGLPGDHDALLVRLAHSQEMKNSFSRTLDSAMTVVHQSDSLNSRPSFEQTSGDSGHSG